MERDMRVTSRILTGLVALAGILGPQALADRYADYWKPENMAKLMCASVHIGYLPAVDNCMAAYQETVIEKSAPGTYFSCNNFSNGYIGVQELANKREDGSPIRVAIFSIWDAKDSGDNPHAALSMNAPSWCSAVKTCAQSVSAARVRAASPCACSIGKRVMSSARS